MEFKTFLQKALEKTNVIICIDELDRCNPNFVVSFIDIITHFFDIKNLVFILGVNHNYIEKSITHVYSKEIATDGEGYLTKFINFSIELPLVLDELIEAYTYKYDLNEFSQLFIFNISLKEFIKQLMNDFNVSVRLLDKIFQRLHFFLKNYSKVQDLILSQQLKIKRTSVDFLRIIILLSVSYETKKNLFAYLYDIHTWDKIIPNINYEDKVNTINFELPHFFTCILIND